MPETPKPLSAPEAIKSVRLLWQASNAAALPLAQHQQLQLLRDRLIEFISSKEPPEKLDSSMNVPA